MTTIAVMQPAYLPWLGYFDLMDQVDVFVLLDSVPFSHQSWQHRNRIRDASGLTWLTIPVTTAGRAGQAIRDVEIDPRHNRFAEKHARSIALAYARARRDLDVGARIQAVYREVSDAQWLLGVTIPIMEMLAQELGVITPRVRSSELGLTGKRSELLIALCRHLGADVYLTTPGSTDYLLVDRDLFADAGVDIKVQGYVHPTYEQCWRPFVSHASALDLVLTCGPDSPTIMRSGRRDSVSLAAA